MITIIPQHTKIPQQIVATQPLQKASTHRDLNNNVQSNTRAVMPTPQQTPNAPTAQTTTRGKCDGTLVQVDCTLASNGKEPISPPAPYEDDRNVGEGLFVKVLDEQYVLAVFNCRDEDEYEFPQVHVFDFKAKKWSNAIDDDAEGMDEGGPPFEIHEPPSDDEDEDEDDGSVDSYEVRTKKLQSELPEEAVNFYYACYIPAPWRIILMTSNHSSSSAP